MIYDVAIVGGGLAGCATAYYLTRHGLTPIVIEAGALNAGASGANAGSLHFQLEQRLIAHGAELAEAFAAVIPLSKLAIELWRGLEADLDLNLEVAMEGGVMVAETAEDMALLERKAALEARWGLETELLDGPALQRKLPGLGESVIGAAYCASEGHANPRLVTLGFARRARENGAHFRTERAVTAFARERARWRLQLADGEPIEAAAVVNAAGAWAGEVGRLANLHVPIVPVAIQMNASERADPGLGLLVQHASRPLSLKQVRDGNYLIGGGWPARLPPRSEAGRGDTPRTRPEHIAGNLALACRIFPELGQRNLLRSWSGTVGVTPDQLPLLGRLDALAEYYVIGGGSGFTLGPAYASILAEIIAAGESAFPVAPYTPNRFHHLNMFMGA